MLNRFIRFCVCLSVLLPCLSFAAIYTCVMNVDYDNLRLCKKVKLNTPYHGSDFYTCEGNCGPHAGHGGGTIINSTLLTAAGDTAYLCTTAAGDFNYPVAGTPASGSLIQVPTASSDGNSYLAVRVDGSPARGDQAIVRCNNKASYTACSAGDWHEQSCVPDPGV